MKRINHIFMCILLSLALTVGAFAADVPESFVCENLNGQQRIIKTYVLPPNGDADALREAPFIYEGYRYTWAYTTTRSRSSRRSRRRSRSRPQRTTSRRSSRSLPRRCPMTTASTPVS